MSRYKHIFFDLDHTLWDFTSNSRATLTELYHELKLDVEGIPTAGELIASYEEVNKELWGQYEQGHIPKEVMRVLRFRTTLRRFGITKRSLPETLSHEYLERCPRRTVLFPGVIELLQDLQFSYRLHIITNGFDEVQRVKLKSSGIEGLFQEVVTSERVGASKPSPLIFAHAQRRAGALSEESLMVGDNVLSDMLGARQAGWDHAHFTAETAPDPAATYRVQHMDELRPLLL
jgi:putative hydrolase of the HAD superfamily